jgi:flagella basal body P-ring formation protein FlgA
MTTWISLALAAVAAGAGPCVRIPSDRVLARDLAPALPEFAAADGGADLGPAPRAGVVRHLLPADTRRLAARAGVRLDEAPGVCLERVSQTLTAERVRAAIEGILPEARIELLDFSRYPLPVGELEFRRETMPAVAAESGAILWRGVLRTGPAASVPVWARVRLKTKRSILTAARALPAGVAISPADVRVETTEGPALREPPARIEDLAGMAPRRTIQPGEVIQLRMLRPAADIRAGQQVDVEVESGGVRLRLTGRAESEARQAEPVWVRLEEGNRRIRGIAAGKGMVIVNAEEETPDDGRRAGGAGRADRVRPLAKGR